MYPSLSENMICYYYKKLASVAPEPFRRCPQAAPPASRAPPGRTMAPQARMYACASAGAYKDPIL